ncbi:MAG: DUF1351 domain-containing protein [Acholeplasmataceae bacterium]
MSNQLVDLEVKVVSKEGSIQFSNFESLKSQVNEELKKYQGLTLTDDNKKDIKKVKADLNKVSKALNDERISIKKEYVKPLELFESQVKEVTSLIKDAVDKLDVQVKEAEDAEKEEKKQLIEIYFNELVKETKIDFITFDDIGLNITLGAKEKALKEETKAYIDQVLLDLEEINSDANAERLLAKYRLSKNLQQSRIQLNYELQQENAIREETKSTVENVTVQSTKVEIEDEKILTIEFKATAPKSKLIALREYMKVNGITYE